MYFQHRVLVPCRWKGQQGPMRHNSRNLVCINDRLQLPEKRRYCNDMFAKATPSSSTVPKRRLDTTKSRTPKTHGGVCTNRCQTVRSAIQNYSFAQIGCQFYISPLMEIEKWGMSIKSHPSSDKFSLLTKDRQTKQLNFDLRGLPSSHGFTMPCFTPS